MGGAAADYATVADHLAQTVRGAPRGMKAGIGSVAAYAKQVIRDKLIEHRQYIHEHGQDLPEIREWMWEAES